MVKKSIVYAAVVTCLCATTVSPPLTAASLDESFNTLEQWVETERIISRERADWESEHATIQDLIAIYEEELALLEGRIERAEAAVSATDRERGDLLDVQEELREIQQTIRTRVENEEARLRRLVEFFPRPLRQELQPLINRIPREGEETRLSLSQRMQNIVGILGQADSFNNAVTPVSETREFENGTIAVDTLYFGLGIAYYVDGSGDHAGVGYPARGAWRWEPNQELAHSISRLVRIYRKSDHATYVSLPAELTELPD